jgi:hypothetical protein
LGGAAISDGLAVWLDISGNIGKDSNHFGNDYHRNCYYIYNDYLGELAQKRIGQPYSALASAWQGAPWPGCIYLKVLCSFVVIFNACHIDFAAD